MVAKIEEQIATVQGKPPEWTITSDKFNHAFKVVKTYDGFVFFEVRITSGSLPKELTGRYTRAKDAIKAVLTYEENAKPSATVERDRKAEKRKAQKEEV